MVSEHLRCMLRAFEVMAKLLEAFYDSEQLAVVRFICTLRWIQLSRPESNWVLTHALLACIEHL
jgi:hypothetical protein